ncbi:MAG: ATP-dependent 6-phosphofructokinase, partial [Planctomycetes bacterium]|nr:ATP-dependent 6-phosphofructokinase [Planctomycetota bacterium]
MRIGILTGGGDCPGLNPVIRGAVRRSVVKYDSQVIGIRDGWLGLMTGRTMALDMDKVSGILPRGGTILGTSRTNPFKSEDGPQRVMDHIKSLGLDALIAIGGEDTLGVANKLCKMGAKIVGVPKTIDYDLEETDYTVGFDTAINIVMDAIDRLHTTAESHNRVMIVEVMGRDTGWIAIQAGIAGGADIILTPEFPMDIAVVCRLIEQRHARGKNFHIVVIAEHPNLTGLTPEEESLIKGTSGDKTKTDAFGHVRLGGVGMALEKIIEKRTGFETRATVLGHVQRGGSPTAYDRVIGTRYGVVAADFIHEGKFGKMVALRGTKIVAADISAAVGKMKYADPELYEIAKV